ncbi:ABC transporter permease [Amycolatopsis sp. MtRt-6]|uniref:ABC transporter permease n=1 Tax=Amycolatopsis sp. MtRt-6 TaxID=2792782 RepID=UPI001A90BBC7|nr:ABC transporter permease [Amycolatopsis sp. MtRt-6]
MLTEISVVFLRQTRIMLRNPVWVMFGLTQPVLYLALFGPLLTGVSGSGVGGARSWQVLVPGLLLWLVILGAGFAGFGILREMREGVIDRQRVTPAWRLSLIAGRSLSNTATIAVQSVVLVVAAIPFGLRASWPGVVLALLLFCVLAMGISIASYAAGIALKSEDSFSPVVQGLSMPLLLLSGLLLPMSVAPAWLRTLSRVNPLTYGLDATRALFRGELTSVDAWVGSLVTVVVAAALAWWGLWTFQRHSA